MWAPWTPRAIAQPPPGGPYSWPALLCSAAPCCCPCSALLPTRCPTLDGRARYREICCPCSALLASCPPATLPISPALLLPARRLDTHQPGWTLDGKPARAGGLDGRALLCCPPALLDAHQPCCPDRSQVAHQVPLPATSRAAHQEDGWTGGRCSAGRDLTRCPRWTRPLLCWTEKPARRETGRLATRATGREIRRPGLALLCSRL